MKLRLKFEELYSIIKEFKKKRNSSFWGLIGITGVNFGTLLISPLLFFTLLIIALILIILTLTQFYRKNYEKEFSILSHFGFRNGRPIERPITIYRNKQTRFWIRYRLSSRVEIYYIIIPIYYDYKIEFPERPNNITILEPCDHQHGEIIIIKGDLTRSSIREETLEINFTSIRTSGLAKFSAYSLIQKDLTNFKKRMNQFINEDLVLK